VRHDAFPDRLNAEVIPDQVGAHAYSPAEPAVPWYRVIRGNQRLTGKVYGIRAELVWFLAPTADGAHDCQFSLL